MSELSRTSPLGGAAPAVHRAPGVELSELRFPSVFRLQTLRADLASLSATASDRLPLTPNSTLGEDPWLLWRAPGDWLAYSLTLPAAELERELATELNALPLFWMDVSSTGALFEIRGRAALDVLMRDCTLDLEGSAVPPVSCAQTSIAQLTVMIHRPTAAAAWRLWVDRSAARHLWEWLIDTAGGAPSPPASPVSGRHAE